MMRELLMLFNGAGRGSCFQSVEHSPWLLFVSFHLDVERGHKPNKKVSVWGVGDPASSLGDNARALPFPPLPLFSFSLYGS